jgi:glycosyltransferase involved in cell wall biosynthesis
MSDSKPMRVLALCDSPAVRPGTAPTGFARVARNLFAQWPEDVEIDIWALHFDGWGYRDLLAEGHQWTLFPGGNRDWNTPARLNALLKVLSSGRYTHVWMLADADALCVGNGERSFPNQLRACCKKHGIKSLLYFPIDCDHQEFAWMEMIKAVDAAVTFTEYGASVVRETLSQSLFPIHVLPHGLDAHFVPVENEGQKAECRKQIILESGRPFAGEKDFLLLNVNKNEWRKDPLRSLEILKGLVERGLPAKMVFRMSATSVTDGINIPRAAAQLGLEDGVHYVLLDAVPEQHLPKLYQACDLYITTTLGEGWGLGITEALGCGVPVAMPMHTSCGEIGENILTETEKAAGGPRTFSPLAWVAPIVWLEKEGGQVCGNDTRLRCRVDLLKAIRDVEKFWRAASGAPCAPVRLPPEIREWLSWERIAKEFLKLMK